MFATRFAVRAVVGRIVFRPTVYPRAVALGLIRLIVGVGVGAALASRRNAGAPPPAPVYVHGPPPRANVSYAAPAGVIAIGTLAVVLGVALIAFQTLLTAVDHDEERWWHLAAGVLGNAAICFGPALLLYGAAGWLVWRARRFARLQALCDTHARLPLATLAAHLRTSEEMAHALVLDAVERRLVYARLDLEPGMILSGTAATGAGRQWAGTCRSCSAPVQIVLAPGQPAVCPYCQAALGATG